MPRLSFSPTPVRNYLRARARDRHLESAESSILYREVAMKKTITATGAAILLILSAQASAQWAKHPDTSIPQTRDGKPNLSARAPKARDGKPDFSGVWRPDG